MKELREESDLANDAVQYLPLEESDLTNPIDQYPAPDPAPCLVLGLAPCLVLGLVLLPLADSFVEIGIVAVTLRIAAVVATGLPGEAVHLLRDVVAVVKPPRQNNASQPEIAPSLLLDFNSSVNTVNSKYNLTSEL